MEYKGFRTKNIEMEKIDEDTERYFTTIINTSEYKAISAGSLQDIEEEFHRCVDEFLKHCEEIGKNPYVE